MGLKIWLPMLGNLNNQGLLQGAITPMATSVTANSNGKIGSCMSCNGTADSNIRIPPVLKYTDNFTIACWVKFNSTSNQCLFSQRTAVNSFGFTIFYLNGHGIRLDDGRSLEANNIITTNTWYHITCCRDDTTTYIYLNGTLVATGTRAITAASNVNTNYAFIGGSQHNADGSYAQPSNNVLNGYLNDYRIYDHCLSAAEVHEISQGLVLHYKLDMPANINNNLYTGSEKFTGTWGNGGSWTTSTETYQNFVVKQRSNTWSGLYQNIPCTQNDIFTISFYGKVDSGGAIQSIHRSNLGNVTTGLQLLDGNFAASGSQFWVRTSDDGTSWKRYWATVKITGSDITYLQWRLENSVSGKNFYICGLKLERGSVPTPWSPAASEAGETNIIRDSSGYNNNGVTYNSPAISSNTPRYSSSTLFDSSKSQCIKGSTGALVTDAITVSLWMYMSNWSTMTATMRPITAANSCGWYIDPYNDGYITIWVLVGPSSNNSNKLALRSNIKYKQLSSGWHHMAFTYDQASTKFYIEGELDSSKTWSTLKPIYYTSSTNLFLAAKVGSATVPNGGYFNGGLSDVRIYCTALSAADIKQLYEVGAKVDNKGNLHCYEAKENASNIIFKIDSARVEKKFQNGLSSYTQANCQVTLTNDGYRIYRPPNKNNSSNGGANNMWGGLMLVNQTTNTISAYNATRDNNWKLVQGHTYLAAFHAKGQSTNATQWSWSNNMGWGGGGVSPSPTVVLNDGIPANFQGEKDCVYIFTINDTISKNCTSAYASYTAGTAYLAYRHLTFGWGYTNTGTLGTDLYLTNFRLYDITSHMAQFTKQGIANFYDFVEETINFKIRKNSEAIQNNLIEI